MKKKRAVLGTMCLFCVLSVFLGTTVQAADSHTFVAPPSIPQHIIDAITKNSRAFQVDLEILLKHEKDNLLILVDKKHLLSADYVPVDLIPLAENRAYVMNRRQLSLTRTAEQALNRMATAMKKEGMRLPVSSSYRAYKYQKHLFARYVKESGEAQAERFSARAGSSQHQLGTVVDFGSISDEFAKTRAGQWVFKNAGKYGWSLSYPKGLENITGYMWEPWHYRYIGEEACAMQEKWFDGVQQYMLVFIDAWKKQNI